MPTNIMKHLSFTLMLTLFSFCSINARNTHPANEVDATFETMPTSTGSSNERSLEKVTNVMKRVVDFYSRYSQEKVYLHFDNTGYFQGETMWFAGYVYDVGSGYQTSKSRVLYVELINPSGDIIDTQKFKLLNGRTHGQIHLDSLIVTGFYEIRAYTRYMMNWDGDVAFSRVFPVFKAPKAIGNYANPQLDQQSFRRRLPSNRTSADDATGDGNEPQNTTKRGGKKTSIHLFPEGGNLVRGLHSRVAYTIVTDGEETCRGITDLTPTASSTTISVKDSDGKSMTAALPKVYQEGCVLTINNDDDVVTHLSIQCSDSLRGKVLAYALLNEGQFEMCDTFTATAHYEKDFERSTLNGGVNQAVVFDPDGRMLCDRLFFVYPHDELDSISITTPTTQLSPCGKVTFDLQTRPNSKLSFSAIDAGTCLNGKHGSIATYMLLGSEVRGYIANPEYYFEADDRTHRQLTDLLMMVQGWRRFEWDDMAAASPRRMNEMLEDGLYLKGQLKSKSKRHAPEGVDLKAFLYNSQGSSATGSTQTDEAGKFLFAMPDIENEWNLQIQTKVEDKLTSYWVTLDRHFAPASRLLAPGETRLIEGAGRWKDDPFGMHRYFSVAKKFNDDTSSEFEGFSNGAIVLPTITIKKTRRILGDTNHFIWYDENYGSRFSSIYYDCDRASDQIADRGEYIPTFYSWLASVNEFFSADEPTVSHYKYINPNYQPSSQIDEGLDENEFLSQTNTQYSINIYADGFTYKNRQIIWIINNKYAGISGLPKRNFLIEDKMASTNLDKEVKYLNFKVLEPTIAPFPLGLEDVKSIYISEDERASERYLLCNEAQSGAVTIFLYTHNTESTASNRGLRKTHFQGFSPSETFQMEDYSVLPPMEDYRRTLFWAPNVKTDENGHATIEFWNNSSCRSMYISAEGVSQDGVLLVGD